MVPPLSGGGGTTLHVPAPLATRMAGRMAGRRAGLVRLEPDDNACADGTDLWGGVDRFNPMTEECGGCV